MRFMKRREEDGRTYTLPAETSTHEGTWLIWPHRYTYGTEYVEELEGIWVQMVGALCTGENVHIIAYSDAGAESIKGTLQDNGIDMGKVDLHVIRSDDVWIRDTGPIFVEDQDGEISIAGFRFDGWGAKAPFRRDGKIAAEVSRRTGVPYLSISDLVLEGGAVETDGRGTAMATLSSLVSDNRNRSMTKEQVEAHMSRYLGISNFIWLNGVLDEDITDAHIDGIARFADERTILTVSKKDYAMMYEDADPYDHLRLEDAMDSEGAKYRIVEVPLTKKTVDDTGFHGAYLNYYVGNEVVLIPVYNDENDSVAVKIISDLYPGRKAVPIVANNLVKHGGAMHCVTQQQPARR